MEISFFASKCRYCGEPVGRPKEEVRQLTIHDLGGEHGCNYKPNENVLDAIEQFRMELSGTGASEQSKAGSSSSGDDLGGIPGLSALSDFDQPTSSGSFGASGAYAARQRARARRGETSLGQKMTWVGVFLILAILLVVFGGEIKEGLSGLISGKEDETIETVDNHALEMLQGGKPKSEALQEALNAASVADTAENRRVLDFVRNDITQEIQSLLNADPWEPSLLEKASKLASAAADVDRSSAITALRDTVADEIFAYSLILKELQPDENTVTLLVSVRGRSPESMVVATGELVLDRFRVKNVTREYVRLEDTLRKTSRGINRQFQLYMDGTIRAK